MNRSDKSCMRTQQGMTHKGEANQYHGDFTVIILCNIWRDKCRNEKLKFASDIFFVCTNSYAKNGNCEFTVFIFSKP